MISTDIIGKIEETIGTKNQLEKDLISWQKKNDQLIIQNQDIHQKLKLTEMKTTQIIQQLTDDKIGLQTKSKKKLNSFKKNFQKTKQQFTNKATKLEEKM